MNEAEFASWYRRLNINEKALLEIQNIRLSEPSRRVGGGKKNVSGRFPSQKMGRTIQFESHRNELAHIYKLEHDEDVLEYYDQPPQIFLDYLSKNGRRNCHGHTPDFFVIRKNSAGWEECKTLDDLLKLEQNSPNRFQKDSGGKWHCPPGEEYAKKLGLYYLIKSSALINFIFGRNFIWLEDYFNRESLEVDEVVLCAVRSLVEASPGIVLSELLHRIEIASVDDLHILIATNQLYVDLNTAPLSQPELVPVFLNEEVARTYSQITKLVAPNAPMGIHYLEVTVGTSLWWDGEFWEIINTGEKSVGLLRGDGKFTDLPNMVFEGLVQNKKITALTAPTQSTINSQVEELLSKASKSDREIAASRYKQIEPFVNGTSSIKPNRSERRWIASYRQAEKIYGRGFVGLLPKHRDKGNYLPKISNEVKLRMEQHIKDNYETIKQNSIRHAHESFKEECTKQGLKPPSRELYRQFVRNRPIYQQIKKRMGDRAAYQEEPFNWVLDRDTPTQGERPFEICHIDHTQADVELLSSIMISAGVAPSCLDENANMGRPWVSALMDTYSRRILAVYITFDPPSYRSNMMVLRICVQKYGRLPQIIVTDGGCDFDSTYFETLLAYFRITKKQRPAAKPRYGSVIESFFGVADKEFWHNLMGNTQIMKNVRQVTKGVNPKNHAVWTLSKLYSYFCEYCYSIYDSCPHPALRMSPREAFNIGMARGGTREHKFICAKEFKLLALPSPTDTNGTRTVTQQGVKINYLYYWHPSFSRIRNTKVEVKYDPFDITVAYAYVNGEWVKCHSSYLRELQSRSERELIIASNELKKLNQLQNKQFADITGKKLAQFFTRIEMEEAALAPQEREAKKAITTQHLRDAELMQVHVLFESESIALSTENLHHIEPAGTNVTENSTVVRAGHSLSAVNIDDEDDTFEPLEEW